MTPPTPPEQFAPPAIASTVDANQPIAAAVSLTEVEVRAMNVNQLKEQLKKRSKSTNGKKSVLTERLLACLNAPVVSQEEARKGEKLAKVYLKERSKNNHVPIRLSVPDRPCMVWPAAAK
jgi:benzoyl-CoA reductase/2-hydroxyglutaryl-CoA dehydratase subunit BcrC/BadD/HgdB